MIKALNSWKKITIYGLVTLFIFSFSLILMIIYNFYIQTINLRDDKKSKTGMSDFECEQSNNTKYIERIRQLKVGYKIDNEKNPHIFLIDVIKIDNCKYIMVHNHIDGDTDLAIIHANDCENCKK
jgi:hypothetical protein